MPACNRRIIRIILWTISLTVLFVWIRTVNRLSQYGGVILCDGHQGQEESLSSSSMNTQGGQAQQRAQTLQLPRVMAIYFPQFHPDPLNDRLWGPNFTDWDSLRKAPPHNRLGYPLSHPAAVLSSDSHSKYYDLRDTAVRRKQGELALQYAVDGFIVHHYWFYDPQHPGPNLHAPWMQFLRDGQPHVPFFFNWCATSWTALWSGQAVNQTKEATQNDPGMLQKQYFDVDQDAIAAHYHWLRPFFRHNNYVKVQNQPIFMVYQWFPEIRHILEQLRQMARADGWDGLYILMGRGSTHPDLLDISQLPENLQRIWKRKSQQLELMHPVTHQFPVWNQTVAYPYPFAWMAADKTQQRGLQVPAWCRRRSHPYSEDDPMNMVRSSVASLSTTAAEVPSLLTAFDNTPRRQAEKATLMNVGPPDQVIRRFNESLYAAVYYQTCCHAAAPPQLQNNYPYLDKTGASSSINNMDNANHAFVFINAWNEWAEGMSLEPSTVYGIGFLQAVKDVKERILREGCIL